jgi:predicted anti-sigma-YlaC factor YlaD
MGHELTREKESRIFEHLTSCPKCLAEYRLAVRIIRAMRVWWETLPRKDQDQFLAKLEALQMAGRL